MATLMPEMARPATGPRLPQVPVIEHPAVRRGDKAELNIRGSSRRGQREHTFVAQDKNKVYLGLNRNNLPALNNYNNAHISPRRRNKKHDRVLTWPLAFLQKPEALQKGHQKTKTEVLDEYPPKPKSDVEELEDMVREKVTNGYMGLKHTFKSNDPNGQGNISREALHRILFTMCGYIPAELFQKFLKRLNLENKTWISFDSFASCFIDSETIQKEWLSPVQQKALLTLEQKREKFFKQRETLSRNIPVTATYVAAVLKDRAAQRKLDIYCLFPPSCFEPCGMIVPPQLREAVAQLGMTITDDEFRKLWSRYNLKGGSAIRTDRFLHAIGLNYTIPPPTSAPSGEQTLQAPNYEDVLLDAKQRDAEQKMKALAKKKRQAPAKLERVIDCLHYQFEHPYNGLLKGCEIFDFLKNGYIARIDLKKVLKEFGFSITSMELDYFLSKCNVRTVSGEINYKELLTKYMNRSEQSVMSRIMNDSFHVFSKDNLPMPGDQLSADEMEAMFIEFLHKDFLYLLATWRNADRYNLGVIPQHEFRSAIEKVLGNPVTSKQWEQLKAEVEVDADGLIPYTNFLEKFVISPGSWNKKKVSVDAMIPHILKEDMKAPPEVERLRELKMEEDEKRNKEEAAVGRSLEELSQLIKDMLKDRFHALDSCYKEMDRKSTGRLSKEQLRDVLDFNGLPLSNEELNRVWKSLVVSNDGLTTMSSFLSQFMDTDFGPNHWSSWSSSIKPGEVEGLQSKTPVPVIRTESVAPSVTPVPIYQDKKVVTDKHLEELQFRPALQTAFGKIRSKSGKRQDLLEKIKTDVTANWEHFKFIFRTLDGSGLGKISIADMKDCFETLEFALSSEETDKICSKFDLNNDGQFHYLPFLQMYTDKPPSRMGPTPAPHTKPTTPAKPTTPLVYSRKTYALEPKQDETDAQVPIEKAINTIRDELLREWKTLRRAFKKLDINKNGYLEVSEFRKVMLQCGIKVSEEDLFHILTEFDKNLEGKVPYEEFLNSLVK